MRDIQNHGEFITRLIACQKCKRLVEYRSKFPESYWKKPVPPNGSIESEIVIVGLAPAPEGGNRTGRMFTGDESGNNLTKALYAVELANQPYSTSKDDGLILYNVYITSVVKCSPPDHKPMQVELNNCKEEFLKAELKNLKNAKVFVALGVIAYKTLIEAFEELYGVKIDKKFKHNTITKIEVGNRKIYLIASYHPSPRNVRTGRLSIEELKMIFERAKALIKDEVDNSLISK